MTYTQTSIPINAPAAGVIEELLVEDGTTVQPGKPIFKLRVGAGGPPAAAKPAAKAEASSAPPPPPVSKPPSEPIGHVIQPKPAAVAKPPASSTPPPKGDAPSPGARTETRVKINRMRQRIAQRLKDAQNTNAMLTTFNEIDMT